MKNRWALFASVLLLSVPFAGPRAEAGLQSRGESSAWGTLSTIGTAVNRGSRNWGLKSHAKGTGVYVIRVEGAFAEPPAVVVSGYRDNVGAADEAQDNAFSVRILNNNEFEVLSVDVAKGPNESGKGVPQDAGFSFIAIWR